MKTYTIIVFRKTVSVVDRVLFLAVFQMLAIQEKEESIVHAQKGNLETIIQHILFLK
jgi:hypothetical protein